jgi:hypothetical protein
MNRADVECLYERRDVAGLYAAAADEKSDDGIRHAAYRYLSMLDDENARLLLGMLRRAEDARMAEYAAKHRGSAVPTDSEFSFESVRAQKRRWWQR